METGHEEPRRTPGQRAGAAAEELVAGLLARRRWQILGRNVHAGRSELDIVAIDPGPPGRLVVVEVRYRRSRVFGLVEETFDRSKQAQLRRGVGRLLADGLGAGRVALPALPVAIDLAVVEPRDGTFSVRLYRNVLLG
jgi:Holliday junction resolvase-like predicted endonuclease